MAHFTAPLLPSRASTRNPSVAPVLTGTITVFAEVITGEP